MYIGSSVLVEPPQMETPGVSEILARVYEITKYPIAVDRILDKWKFITAANYHMM
jgi:hypothetical protein